MSHIIWVLLVLRLWETLKCVGVIYFIVEQAKSDFKEIIEDSANVRGTQAKITMIQTNLATNKKFLKFMEGRVPQNIF